MASESRAYCQIFTFFTSNLNLFCAAQKVFKSAPFFTVIVHLIVNSIHILMTKEKLSLLPKTESLDKEVGFVLIILGFFIDLQVRQSLLYLVATRSSLKMTHVASALVLRIHIVHCAWDSSLQKCGSIQENFG